MNTLLRTVLVVSVLSPFAVVSATAQETGIAGTVKSAERGAPPIPDAVISVGLNPEIQAGTSSVEAMVDVLHSVTSNASGEFELTGINPGTYVLSVNAEGFEPRLRVPITVVEGAITPVVINLRPAKGTVTEAPGGLLEEIQRQAVETAQAAERAAQAYITSIPASRGGFGRTLVIPSGQMKVADLAAIAKDMGIMSRIFDKTLAKEFGDDFQKSFGNVVLFFGGTTVQGVYMEGYGVLFLLRVKFPLVAPPSREEAIAERPADTIWADTEHELFGLAKAGTNYDATKVENLQRTVLETLKHVTNIRNLKSEDSVAVAVLGDAAGGMVWRVGGVSSFRDYSGYSGFGESPGTVLTVRVKKADVDAFAQGKIALDEFRQRAAILAY